MKQIFSSCFLVVSLLFFSGYSFADCPMKEDFLFANTQSKAWCNMDCIDKMLYHIDHTSRLAVDGKALTEGINTSRACAHAFYAENGLSFPRWNELVDKTNYMLHQAGVIGSQTKASVSSSGVSQAACRLSNSTPCKLSSFSYGKELFETYKTGCMSDLDKQIVFTALPCLYYLEAQQKGIADTEENAYFFLQMIHQAQNYQNNAEPFTRKITSNILAGMERTLTGCHPDMADKDLQGTYDLEEVVVTPEGSMAGRESLGRTISQAVANESCLNPVSHEGQRGSSVGSALVGNGNGDGTGGYKEAVDTSAIWVEIPSDF